MMAGPLFTPSVDSKGAVGEEKCDTGVKNSSPPELKEERGSKAEEGSFRYKILLSLTLIDLSLLFRMGLVQPEALLLAWDGYQCGTCGAEFKTQAELRSHQMSQHSTPSTNTQDTAVG